MHTLFSAHLSTFFFVVFTRRKSDVASFARPMRCGCLRWPLAPAPATMPTAVVRGARPGRGVLQAVPRRL